MGGWWWYLPNIESISRSRPWDLRMTKSYFRPCSLLELTWTWSGPQAWQYLCWSWLFTLGKYVWYVTNISFTAYNGRPPYKTANRKSIELLSVGRYVYVSAYFAWLPRTAKLFAIFSFINYRSHYLQIIFWLSKCWRSEWFFFKSEFSATLCFLDFSMSPMFAEQF